MNQQSHLHDAGQKLKLKKQQPRLPVARLFCNVEQVLDIFGNTKPSEGEKRKG